MLPAHFFLYIYKKVPSLGTKPNKQSLPFSLVPIFRFLVIWVNYFLCRIHWWAKTFQIKRTMRKCNSTNKYFTNIILFEN